MDEPVAIERDFRAKVSDQLSLAAEGIDRFRVIAPFVFEDGDHLAMVLKREGSEWILTDEGHTFMHLSYTFDEKELRQGTRQRLITDAITVFGLEDRDGELIQSIPEGRYGDALFSFVQALLKISDVTYLKRERVRSTFMEDFREFMRHVAEGNRISFDWNEPSHDPERRYTVDCRINGIPRPLFVFALPNDDKVRDATINLLQFERWSLSNRSIGIYENQEEVNRKVVARFSDVCEKQFSSLSGTKDRIEQYIRAATATS